MYAIPITVIGTNNVPWSTSVKADASGAGMLKNINVVCEKNSNGPIPPPVDGIDVPRFEVAVVKIIILVRVFIFGIKSWKSKPRAITKYTVASHSQIRIEHEKISESVNGFFNADNPLKKYCE